MSLTFLKSFISNPAQVGAIAPSSQFLAEEMVRWYKWDDIKTVIEYGPGTGSITGAIRDSLRPDANFFVIERSPKLCQVMRTKFPDVTIFEDTVENVKSLCAKQEIDKVDAVVCGLPWASFPERLQQSCLDSMAEVLAPDAQFATFAYWQGLLLPAARRFRSKLDDYFGEITASPTVLRNLPPAFIYRCSKPKRR